MDSSKQIWTYLIKKIANPAAVAGIMGNLRAESALRPDNVQNSFESKLGADAVYVKRVDEGVYGREKFSKDGAGFGLAQWTYWSRKAALWDHLKGQGLSIADLEGQLAFMLLEMQASGLLKKLETSADVTEATALVLRAYEKPADQSDAAVARRAAYSKEYLDKFGTVKPPARETSEQIREALEHLDKVREILEGLY